MANFQVELPDGRKFTIEGAASAQAAAEGIQQISRPRWCSQALSYSCLTCFQSVVFRGHYLSQMPC